ncbi:hypothetical protein AKJ18_24015, partial [Vibrio xuii]
RYNWPTLRSVVTRSLERTWVYVRKVGTIVLAVSTIIFVLLQFPGIPDDQQTVFQQQAQSAVKKFQTVADKTQFAGQFDDHALTELVNFYTDYRRAKLNAQGAEASAKVNQTFKQRNADFFAITAAKVGKDTKKLTSA